jgi:hypothetical protein
MEFIPTDIADVVVIDPVVFEDDRGFLMETWQARKCSDAGIDARFAQDVRSRSLSIAWPVQEGVTPVLAENDVADVRLKGAEIHA